MDIKVPRSQRGQVPILWCDDHIIWIVGYRLDDRVRLTEKTRRMLRLRYKRVGSKR
jgi:tRNA(Ile)-lysidine synthase